VTSEPADQLVPTDQLVPAGTRLRPDASARLLAGGRILVGGAPVRVLRLTPAGARQVATWLAGAPVPDTRPARALARRLLDVGIAHPAVDVGVARLAVGVGVVHPATADGSWPGLADVTIVVPARDRVAMLARCLAGLTQPGQPPVIVVDDGSADAPAVAAAAAAAGACLVRRPRSGGPGAARNTGAAAVGTPVVAFVDSDCVPRPGWLEPLLAHFTDPAIGAVAPRIVAHEQGTTWLGRYEGVGSALDMGPRGSVVSPGTRVPYVPTAALVVRREAIGRGFAEDIQAGEDVDFVWRLAASGWRVRYEPGSAVAHQHRIRLRPWFRRRMHYGTSAAVLEARHPGMVRPLNVSRWTAAAWLAAAAGFPAASVAVGSIATAVLARRLAAVTGERWPLPGPSSPATGAATTGAATTGAATAAGAATATDVSSAADASWTAWRLAVRLAGGGTVAAGRPIGAAITRAWWPVAVPIAVAVPRLRAPLAALMLAPPLLDWVDLRPPLDPARYVAGRLLGDVAYSIGLWKGCARQRDVRALLPATGVRAKRNGGGHAPTAYY
jgi:mycofactocin system glycosyltransferase